MRITCLVVISVLALCIQVLGDEQIKQARREAARRFGGLVINDDAVDTQNRTPEQFIAARLAAMANTPIGLVTHETIDTDNVVTHPSNVVETVKSHLIKAGHDPVALEFCHANDIPYFPSIRMNDVHDAMHPKWQRTAVWKREHQDYLLGKHGDNKRFPHWSVKAWWSAKNFEVPQVRDRQYRVLEEMCQVYDLDGLELDWLRAPILFPPTLDMKPAQPKHIEIMNHFMRRVRKMTDRAAGERGRPLLVAVRVPMNVERSLALGLDLQTWFEEDLVDMLVVGGGYAPMAMAQSVQAMVQFARPFDVPVYACISASGMKQMYGGDTVEAYRGAAMNVFHAGAGVYLFNFPYGLVPSGKGHAYSRQHTSPKQAQLYHELGSVATLKGLDKVYGVDHIVEPQFQGCSRPGLVIPDRLPLALKPGGAATAKLPVGEDIVANAPEGKSAHARLRLRLSHAVSADDVTVRFNGQALSRIATGGPAFGRENLLINPDFEQGHEVGETVPGWRGSGYDGSKHMDAKFVIGDAGRGGSRGAVLARAANQSWVIADQYLMAKITRDPAIQFSVWLRAQQPSLVGVHLYLHLPKQKRYDVASARNQVRVTTQWKEFRSTLVIPDAATLQEPTNAVQLRAIIQLRGPGAEVYVDDAALIPIGDPRFEFDVDPALVRAGYNDIELGLTGRQMDSQITVERLSLAINYR